MQIDNALNTFATKQMQPKPLGIKPLYMQKVQGDELKKLKQQVFDNMHAFTFNLTITQTSVTNIALGKNEEDFQKAYEEFQNFLKDIGYKGKKIAKLSQDEAKKLVSEDGFFGIKQTSQRIADFVIKGANGDEDLLKAGLKGIMQGFDEAEKLWGEKLPEISYKTIDAAKKMVEEEITKNGYSLLDAKV